MSVVLRKRKNADGSTTLRLDIYKDGQRTVETLKHLKLSKPDKSFRLHSSVNTFVVSSIKPAVITMFI